MQQKRGSCCRKEEYQGEDGISRNRWIIDKEIPVFTGENRSYIEKLIYVGETVA